jgi:hypothetical protein
LNVLTAVEDCKTPTSIISPTWTANSKNVAKPHRYPTIFHFQPNQKGAPTYLLNNVTTDLLPLTPPQDRIDALRLLAVNIDEDFLMLLPSSDGDGYSLESVIWCYPVGFDVGGKVGLKLRDAHKPIPGYKDIMQNSMDRYFGRLVVGKVIYRINVSWVRTVKMRTYADD